MIRVKHPIEYKLTPDAVERGSHWLTVRIKNTGDNDLQNLNVKMHSLDSIHISFRFNLMVAIIPDNLFKHK
jgi:hypothetical protein